jgi:hypothetical protein
MLIRADKVTVLGLNDTRQEFKNADVEIEGNFMTLDYLVEEDGKEPRREKIILSSATVGKVLIEGEARETDE